MKTIGEILTKNASVLTNLIRKSKNVQNLASVFHSMLDASLAKHCKLATLEGSKLNVTVTNAAWATRLRYAIPDIIKILRTQPEFKEISTIHYFVNQPTQAFIRKKKQIKLSRNNKILWQETMASLKKKAAL